MKIESRRPINPFDFNEAVGATVMLIGLLIAASIGEAAFYRKYLLGAEPAKVPLRFDRHLLRNAIIQLGFYSLYTVVYIGGALAIGFIALFVGLIAYPIKFAPSSALSHFDDKAHILATRKVTKFRFWPLFGAYLVTYMNSL